MARKKKRKKQWIAGAVKPSNKGKLRSQLGAKPGQPIPISKLRAAAKKGGLVGKRAQFALNMRGLNNKRRSGNR